MAAPDLGAQAGDGESADPGETVAHASGGEASPGLTMPGEPPAGSERLGFLDPPRAPGELGWLAHYRIRKVLGEGGMGLVLAAEDTHLLRPVALKVIRPELSSSTAIAQRFLLEARALASLKHDNIVTIYHVDQHRGVAFLAMEYLQGTSLHRWLERGQEPSVDLILRIGREIAAGLDAAHRGGLTHRDIKPANIWLEAPRGRVKILDFGLARTEGHDPQITNPGVTVGSPSYMAPEQARGERGDPSADLFSLGCVLYQLCTRRMPFPGTSVMAVLTSLANDTPPAPHTTNPAIPASLDDLVMRLLSKDPAGRPPSARAVAESLREIDRELQADRQRAELPSASPFPAVVPATATSIGTEGGPGREAKGRAVRRALAIAAAAALLAIGLVATRIRRGGPHDAATTPTDRPAPAVVAAPAPVREVPRPVPPAKPPAVPEKRAEASKKPEPAPVPVAIKPDPPRPVEKPGPPATPPPPEPVLGLLDGSRVVDPDGDCRVRLDLLSDRASIFVPGVAHLLSAEIGRMNAPRALREIRGDFEVRLRVRGIEDLGTKASTKRYAPYHGGGILVWKDEGNYVRLEIAADFRKGKVFPYANFELRRDGRLAGTLGQAIEDGSSYLRLRRLGEEIHGAFSPDGRRWTPLAPLVADFPDPVEVGIVAVNSSTRPLQAEFDGFQLLVGPRAGPGPGAREGVGSP